MKNLIPLYRKKNSISQLELARRLGISPSYLCKIEKSLQIPSERLIERCSRLLDVNADILFPNDAGIGSLSSVNRNRMNPIWFERIRRGIKQCDLAKRLKCSPSYLSRVENGQIVPTDFFIKQCTLFFKKERSELFPALDSND